MRSLLVILLAAWCCAAHAAEVIPPVPAQWFNDYAQVVSPAAAVRLNQTLQDFERESSSQIVVAIFQKMESASSIEDYTVRVAQAWKVGQQSKKNGVVLFVFVQDRKMFIQVGYGLEGALPDATCKRIIEDEIKPRFRNNDYDGGLSAGVAAILAAHRTHERAADGALEQLDQGPVLSLGSETADLLLLAVLIAPGELVGTLIIGAFEKAQPPCPALRLALGTRSEVGTILRAHLDASCGR